MRDLISRSDFRRVLVEIQTDAEHFGNIERRTEIGSIISLLDQQPSKTNWIPVSERLPEKPNDYFVTQYNEEYINDYCDGYRVSTIFFDSNGWWDDIDYDCGWRITAWQPLPDPYKEG